jgi:hypothetical protein
MRRLFPGSLALVTIARNDIDTAVLSLLSLAQPHARPAPVLVDELGACCLQRQAYFGPGLVTTAQGAVMRLQAFYRRNRYVGSSS